METIIRVGEKNNFNHTREEYKALEKYSNKGKIFVNSNSFTRIDNKLPSFVTLNPYLIFTRPTGKLDNVKAFRVKMFVSENKALMGEQIKALKYANKKGIPVLITFMRFRRNSTMRQFSCNKTDYFLSPPYYRPTQKTKNTLKLLAHSYSSDVHYCDDKGKGCPDCMNCSKLSYGLKKAEIKALNLSCSGIADRHGNKGICPFSCPDCFAKDCTRGRRPACDRLIVNRKMKGEIVHE